MATGELENHLGKVFSEAEIYDAGWHYTLSDLCDYYFPEGTNPPSQQMERILKFCNSIFATSDQLFFLSPTEFEAIVNDGHSYKPTNVNAKLRTKTEAMNLMVRNLEGPALTFYTGDQFEIEKTFSIMSESLRLISIGEKELFFKDNIRIRKLKKKEFAQASLGPSAQVFEIQGEENKLLIKRISGDKQEVKKTPFIIIEKIYSEWRTPTLSMKIAVENDSENYNIQNYSRYREIFQYSILYPSINGPFVLESGQVGQAELYWQFDRDQPLAIVSKNAMKLLKEPVDIGAIYNRMLRLNNLFLIPQTLEQQLTLRDYIPQYYLELITLAGYLANQNGEIYEETFKSFNSEFGKLANLFSYDTKSIINKFARLHAFRNIDMSQSEYLFYELLLEEKDIWRDLDKFYLNLTRSVLSDPKKFWKFVYLSGLRVMIPAFRQIKDLDEMEKRIIMFQTESHDGIEAFCKAFDQGTEETILFSRNEKEDYFSYWTRIINLLPNIFSYRDYRPGKEDKQSKKFIEKLNDSYFIFLLTQNLMYKMYSLNLKSYIPSEEIIAGEYTYDWFKRYDLMLEELEKKGEPIEQKLIREALESDITGKTILDAGFGTGRLVKRFSDLGTDVYGIDRSKGAVRFAGEKYSDLARKLQQGDIANLPFEDNSFDIIVCKYVLNETEDIDAALNQFQRCLKSGGKLLIFVHHPSSQRELSRDVGKVSGSRLIVSLSSDLSAVDHMHDYEDYLSEALTKGFVIDRIVGSRTPDQPIHKKDQTVKEMLFIKATKR